MRVIVAVLLACALAAPAHSQPFASRGLSAPAAAVTPVKAKAKAAKGKAKGSKCAPGAICPLVGGGDY